MLILLVLIKATLAALVVVVATIAVERAGPFWGALIASLPIAATPAYIVIGLEHPPEFVTASLLSSLSSNAAVFVLLTAMMFLATRLRNLLALVISLAIWLGVVLVIQQLEWTPLAALLLNLAACASGIAVARAWPPKPVVIARGRLRTWEIALRAALVAALIGTISIVGEVIGPSATGVLAVFPVVYTSMSAILLLRHGGEATAAMMANSFVPLMGFAIAVLAAHLATAAFGVWPGLAIGLAVSFTCAVTLMAWRRLRVRSAVS